ncbi:nuclear transport factor 2 family protein [Rhizobium bangladeshense]|nr:nuclear transport factor 2 family protein [Rhizobium bangladeshense]MBX4917373.1 nuclear transport factor 2 family protein [Rhizobium bangladeshense]
MRRRSGTRTATASNLFSRAGSTGADAMSATILRTVVDALIATTNAFDVNTALALFTPDAVIDDPSTGHCFEGHAGIRDYVERYFIGYHTVTRCLSIETINETQGRVRVDFTGDFGHEIGLLDITVNDDGLITRIDAALE